jgi:two-component system, sensor histidine kinase
MSAAGPPPDEAARRRDLDELRHAFVHAAAHELRTPLAPMRAEMHLLRGRLAELDPDAQESVRVLDACLTRLSALVELLLDATMVKAGTLDLRKREMDLQLLARTCLDDLAPEAQARGIRTSLHAPAARVVADPQRISQVIDGLLRNALHATPPGGHVRLRVDEEEGTFRVAVGDSGVGLSPREAESLFQPMARPSEASGRAAAGPGLSLYLAKGVVEMHGGRIGCWSEGPGKGATFWFTLPKAATSAGGPPAEEPTPQPSRPAAAADELRALLFGAWRRPTPSSA